jgi:hypothetical protein
MLGRVENELLGDLIKRSFRILARKKDVIPDAPSELIGRPLEIIYTSPAAKAQYGTKAIAISQFMQDLAQVAQFDPDAVRAIDTPALLDELAKLRDVTRRIMKDPTQLAQEKAAMEQQQQMAQMAQAAPQLSGAIKDVAQAREADPTLVQQLGV